LVFPVAVAGFLPATVCSVQTRLSKRRALPYNQFTQQPSGSFHLIEDPLATCRFV
jgi:hypothetical protein